MQRKVAVGSPDDAFEREADKVAARVAAGQRAPALSRLPATADPPQEEEEPVRRKTQTNLPEEEAIRRKAATEQLEEDRTPVRRATASALKEEDEQKPVQRSGTGPALADAAQRAIDAKDSGHPLDASTRSTLESGLGADLSHVRVHDDAAAQDSAHALNARAFTHGSDIWLGRGESVGDVRLMAHEATHVVQQRGAVQRDVVQRTNGEAGTSPAAAEEEAQRDLKTFRLPRIKARHRPVYQQWAHRGQLKRVAGYDRGEPDQKDSVWIPNVNIAASRLRRLDLDPGFAGQKQIEVHGRPLTGTYTQLLRTLKVPNWDRRGNAWPNPFEVDHIIELQVGNWDGSNGPANTLENMELLDKSSNASAGGGTRSSVRQNVTRYLTATGRPHGKTDVTSYLAANDVAFDRVVLREGGRDESRSQFWTRREIESGEHLRDAQPLRNVGEAGTAARFALVSAGGVMVLGEYPHAAAAREITVDNPVLQTRVAGLKISTITLSQEYTEPATAAGSQIGTVTATWDLPHEIAAAETPVTIPLEKHSQYAGMLGSLPAPGDLHFEGLSPLRLPEISVEGGELTATGQLTPSLPILGSTPIEVRLRGKHLFFTYYFRPEQVSLPVPGITVDDVSLGVFAGTDGFGAEGTVDFTVNRVGSGSIGAGVNSRGEFELSGQFAFDTELFDRAEVAVWYRNRAFGGRGTVAVTTPDKIRGIRAAQLTVTFSENSFDATGTVTPSIPGIREARVTLEYSEAEGLVIGGSVELADDIPGVRSGSVQARVRKPPEGEGYSLSIEGTVQPAIPGLDTTLTVSYDDGAFTMQGSAAYARGMLSGSVEIGVTNRVLDETGSPTDAIGPELRAFGGGTVTVQIAPWLQGTVGVRFLPNGELELSGEIALPAALDLFPEYSYQRNIFSINFDIPIIGFAVARQRVGIFATIGGGLDLSAGVGPGQLQQLRLGVTYNPDHEDQTHVTGDANLVIPAHAGLRLFVRGALGAGIPIVSAQMGLEVGGELGLVGALETGVHVDWAPAAGLVLDARAEIYVEPKFRFDLTGFLDVTADLLITSITLYEKRWELAAFELGTSYRLGMIFPFHYQEGQPVTIDWSTVQFVYPDIDARQILGQLVDRIV